MKLMTKLKLVAASALLSVGFATTSQAATCQFGDVNDFMLSADVYTSTACIDQQSGNDSNTAVSGFFGETGWTQVAKVDEPATSNGKLTITYTGGAPSLSGSWSVTSWAGVAKAMLILKASSGYAAYLLDITAGTSGEWVTQALMNNGGNQPAISHVSLYEVACQPNDPSCDPPVNFNVPVPAGLPLIMTALGVFGIVRSRKRKSA